MGKRKVRKKIRREGVDTVEGEVANERDENKGV